MDGSAMGGCARHGAREVRCQLAYRVLLHTEQVTSPHTHIYNGQQLCISYTAASLPTLNAKGMTSRPLESTALTS